LKSFITVCGQTPRKSHNLADLASTATSLGLPSPSSSLLQDIQCDADVRYSAATVGKAEALRAHYATLSLCSDIAVIRQNIVHSRNQRFGDKVDSGSPVRFLP